MKMSALGLGILLASLWHSPAQVTVDIALDQHQFLPGESLPVAVRITNRSGQTLHLGKDQQWLVVSVESHDGNAVTKAGELPVTGEFTLESSKRAIKTVDVAPYFTLAKPGRYSVVATVTVPEWDRQITSQSESFDIIDGVNMWEQEIGVPRPGGATNSPPEVRKYTLQQANYLRRHLMLYLRLTDTAGKLNKVLAIGPMISFGQPEPQVDRFSNLHVLYQNGPHSFSYTIVDPDGNVLRRRSYDYTTRPRLEPDSNGNLVVTGGRRRLAADDLPGAGTVDTNASISIP